MRAQETHDSQNVIWEKAGSLQQRFEFKTMGLLKALFSIQSLLGRKHQSTQVSVKIGGVAGEEPSLNKGCRAVDKGHPTAKLKTPLRSCWGSLCMSMREQCRAPRSSLEGRAKRVWARDPCCAQPYVHPAVSWETSRWAHPGHNRTCEVVLPAGIPVAHDTKAPSPMTGYTDLL